MDGNGRWAQQRGRPRTFGHQAGLKALRRIVEHCGLRHVPEVTLFAFSSENWSRPKAEVSRLMDLLMRALDKETRELHENGVRLEFIGDLSAFAPAMRDSIGRAMEQTRHNSRLRLNVAVNYGGRQEILDAVRELARRARNGEIDPERIDEGMFRQALQTSGVPDPDLVIRTSGEQRVSNFLLWQSAYTEFIFTPTLWPDFSRADLENAVREYQRRERRFGGAGG